VLHIVGITKMSNTKTLKAVEGELTKDLSTPTEISDKLGVTVKSVKNCFDILKTYDRIEVFTNGRTTLARIKKVSGDEK